MGWYYEQFELEKELVTRRRTVTEADIVTFAGLSGDYNLVHTDEVFAAAGPFGARIAHGPLGLSIAIGLLSQLNVIDDTALALLNVNWDFQGPIRIGDTIHVRATPVHKRETRNPERGILKLEMKVINQHGETVQTGSITLLVQRRPGG